MSALNGCYIDLDITLPITPEELFDDNDIEFIECADPYSKYKEPLVTTNIHWNITNKPSPDGIIGYLTSYDLADKCKDYFDKTFKVNPLTEKPQPGYPYYPITLVRFNQNSAYHREGFADWYTDEHKEVFNSRFQMAINFKMYGEAVGSDVYFGQPSDTIVQQEKELSELLLEKNRKRLIQKSKPIGSHNFNRISAPNSDNTMSVYLGRTGFHDDTFEQAHIKTNIVREGYNLPYIINVQKWHKVITTNKPRVSLRYMCDDKYSFEELEKLHQQGNLINE